MPCPAQDCGDPGWGPPGRTPPRASPAADRATFRATRSCAQRLTRGRLASTVCRFPTRQPVISRGPCGRTGTTARDPWRTPREEDLSAQRHQAQARPRFPQAHGHEVRSGGPRTASRTSAQAPERLNAASCRAARAPGVPSKLKGSLRTRRQFALVYETGRKAVGPRVIAFALPRPSPLPEGDPAGAEGLARGIVASRRVGGAIQRNRAKRVIRAALRPLLPRLRRPLWIVLVARQPSADLAVRSHEVQLELEGLLSRLDVLVPEPSPPTGSSSPC